jgi:hypothetical protein
MHVTWFDEDEASNVRADSDNSLQHEPGMDVEEASANDMVQDTILPTTLLGPKYNEQV